MSQKLRLDVFKEADFNPQLWVEAVGFVDGGGAETDEFRVRVADLIGQLQQHADSVQGRMDARMGEALVAGPRAVQEFHGARRSVRGLQRELSDFRRLTELVESSNVDVTHELADLERVRSAVARCHHALGRVAAVTRLLGQADELLAAGDLAKLGDLVAELETALGELEGVDELQDARSRAEAVRRRFETLAWPKLADALRARDSNSAKGLFSRCVAACGLDAVRGRYTSARMDALAPLCRGMDREALAAAVRDEVRFAADIVAGTEGTDLVVAALCAAFKSVERDRADALRRRAAAADDLDVLHAQADTLDLVVADVAEALGYIPDDLVCVIRAPLATCAADAPLRAARALAPHLRASFATVDRAEVFSLPPPDLALLPPLRDAIARVVPLASRLAEDESDVWTAVDIATAAAVSEHLNDALRRVRAEAHSASPDVDHADWRPAMRSFALLAFIERARREFATLSDASFFSRTLAALLRVRGDTEESVMAALMHPIDALLPGLNDASALPPDDDDDLMQPSACVTQIGGVLLALPQQLDSLALIDELSNGTADVAGHWLGQAASTALAKFASTASQLAIDQSSRKPQLLIDLDYLSTVAGALDATEPSSVSALKLQMRDGV